MIERTGVAARWMPCSLASIGVAFVLVAETGCAINADKSMSEGDAHECQVLAEAVLKNHELPPAVTPFGHDGRALYCAIRQRNPFITHLYTEITLYGVVERSEQDRVIATLRGARGRGYKPIILRFLEREMWHTDMRDGRVVGGRRGAETLLRTEILG